MSILVLDIGTTSMRGIFYDHHGKKLAVHQVKNHPQFLENGVVSESPEDWSGNTYEIFRNIMKTDAAEDLEAISITSQRSSIIPVDRDGRPLMDTIMWQDVRNKDICARFEKYNKKLFQKTGSRVNSVFSGSKMTWVRENCPDIYPKVYKFVNIPEYIMHLMTGGYDSDYTYASRSGLMDLYTKEFDDELLTLYQVERDHLCRLHEPGTIVGKTNESFQEMTGCPAGIPVITAGGDQQCAAIGQGVTESGNVSIVAGTGGFIIAACDHVPENLTDNVICNCSSIAGKYVIEANVLACSAAFDWFAHEMYGMDRIDYAFTESELEKENEPADCLVVPYFKGRGAPDWNSDAKAIFADVTLATRRSEMFKAMMEGVFMELANHLDAFSDYIRLKHIYVSGGVTSSRTLNQLQADIYGKEIINRTDKEATAKGAFLVALVTLGLYPDVNAAFQAVTDEDSVTYRPDRKKFLTYLDKRMRMNRIYELSREASPTRHS